MTVRLYSSLDVGAPQLSNVNDGSLINVLRACLIDGYGTRTPQGWTMPHSDLPNNIAAFRPIGLVDVHVQVDDNYDYRWAKIKGFRAMTAIDTGVGGFPNPITDLVGSAYYLSTSKKQSTTEEDGIWHVVAGDDFFYFMAEDANYPSGFFFGRIVSQKADDSYDFVLTGEQTQAGQLSSNGDDSFFSINSSRSFIMENALNTGSHEDIAVDINNISYINPSPISGELLIDSWKIRNGNFNYLGEFPYFNECVGDPNIASMTKLVLSGKKYHVMSNPSTSWLFEYDEDVG